MRQTLGAERITAIETPGGASNSAFRRRKHPAFQLDAQPWAAVPPRRLSPKAANILGGPHHVPGTCLLYLVNSHRALGGRFSYLHYNAEIEASRG